MIVVGVDAHSQTHAAAAVNGQTGEHLGVREVRAREAGHVALLEWARAFGGERTWALEDCRNLSGALEQLLLASGERVLRVPPKLMASQRKTVRSFGKSDAIDALAIARAALREPDLPEAGKPGAERELGLLSDTATITSRTAPATSAGCAGTCKRSTPTWRPPPAAPPGAATSTASPASSHRCSKARRCASAAS